MWKKMIVLGTAICLLGSSVIHATDDVWPLTDNVGLVIRDYSASGYEPHTGVDIRYDPTTAICTPIAGTVQTVNEDEESGYFVLITNKENGESFILCNLVEVNVAEGDTVSAGDEIGLVGDEYLHVEYIPQGFGQGESVDPTPLLNAGGTRLEYPVSE